LSPGKTVYNLDPHHEGIRVAVLAIMMGGFLLVPFIVSPLLNRIIAAEDAPILCYSLAVGLVIGLGGSWLAERYLVLVWPSGRSLSLDETGITLHYSEDDQIALQWDHPIETGAWHFIINQRRAWVPRGWYCVSCRLSQNGNTMSPYAFFNPKRVDSIPLPQVFVPLLPKEDSLSDEQAFLHLAEGERWESGVEMNPDEFRRLIKELDDRLENWPPERL